MTVEVRDLEVAYGSKKIIKGISFDVNDGEILSILGPNGAGKTTMIKGMCRIGKLDAGSVSINSRDIESFERRELAQTLSYVPQRAVTSMMTVFDSVLIGRKPYIDWNIDSNNEEIVWEVLKQFSMDDLALKYIDEISGGELQKVQIARAVVQDTEVIVLDEPTNNLDLANQHHILSLLRGAVKHKNACCIMIMHDLNLSTYYSDKFIFVKDGLVEAYGGKEIITPETIKRVYGIDCTVEEIGGNTIVVPKRLEDADWGLNNTE
ncbi:ABC transporter ATP-binding protein [Candidatus Methanarcanum hacksteinii]|uniref:ABC transporter ATP-binding protein n=1 Tax=Candidatus Methanarcanum hacksteinii TaxID=2911857 RepID=UPI0037DD200B